MGGSGPEVLVTLTADIGKILDGIHRTKIKGNSHLASSIQVAYVRQIQHRQTINRPSVMMLTLVVLDYS